MVMLRCLAVLQDVINIEICNVMQLRELELVVIRLQMNKTQKH